MKTLHFTRYFSPLTETFVYNYVTGLEQQGVDNHVVTLHRRNERERPFSKVTVIKKPSRWHPRRLWHRILVSFNGGKPFTSNWPQLRDQLERVARRVSPDVLHAHFGPAGVIVAPVARRLNVPLVVHFYGHDISALPEQDFWSDAYANLWSKLSAGVVLSRDMERKAHLQGMPQEKLEVVHLAQDLSNFQFQSPEPPVEKILFVGRLVPKKAPIDAIEAVERANRQGADLSLDVVGDGPLREEVEMYVQKHELTTTVSIHGWIPNEEVVQWMRRADGFILPSKTAPHGGEEGTPTVLIEAQAVGLPCVSTRHAGIPEMIPESNHGFLVTEGDTRALADALVRLTSATEDELSTLAARGRDKVESGFQLRGEVERLKKIYSGVVEREEFKEAKL